MYAKEPDIKRGFIGYNWNNFGGKVNIAQLPSGGNLVAGDLEVWSKGLPVGFGLHGTGIVEQSNTARFNLSAAKLTSIGSTVGLYYSVKGLDYRLLVRDRGRVIMSFWAKSDANTTIFIGARFRNGAEYYTNVYPIANTDWNLYTYAFDIEPKATMVDCVFGMYNQPVGTSVYIDGISIVFGEYDFSNDRIGGSSINIDYDVITEALKNDNEFAAEITGEILETLPKELLKNEAFMAELYKQIFKQLCKTINQ